MFQKKTLVTNDTTGFLFVWESSSCSISLGVHLAKIETSRPVVQMHSEPPALLSFLQHGALLNS